MKAYMIKTAKLFRKCETPKKIHGEKNVKSKVVVKIVVMVDNSCAFCEILRKQTKFTLSGLLILAVSLFYHHSHLW